MFAYEPDGEVSRALKRRLSFPVDCGVVQWQDVRLWTGKSGFKSLPRSLNRRRPSGAADFFHHPRKASRVALAPAAAVSQ